MDEVQARMCEIIADRLAAAEPQQEEWLRRGVDALLKEDVYALEVAIRTKTYRNRASVPPKK